MRQIKFRGKRVDNGEWVYGDYFKTPLTDENSGLPPDSGWFFLTGKTNHCIGQDGVAFVVDPATVSQFTGLLDKNGKEAYEADIMPTRFGNRVIFWDEKRFSFCYTMPVMGQSEEGVFNIYNHSDPEVIGNLHDSPSLTNH